MRYPCRVFLTGGDHSNWALDDDLAQTRKSLNGLSDRIELTEDIESCDVIHSVWELPLVSAKENHLAGKRIVCHVNNDPVWLFEQPSVLRTKQIVGVWVAQSRNAFREMVGLGIPAVNVSYAVNTEIFGGDHIDEESIATLRNRLGIPEGRYVIGNFMRDSLGMDLDRPKVQKGPDLFLAIVRALWQKNLPIHILLAGPRRHWLRHRLAAHDIPFSFFGKTIEGDDNHINILDRKTVNLLYHVQDLHLVTSRWEGGPRAVLEAASTRCKIISTPVGLASDILEPACLFSNLDQGIALIEREMSHPFLHTTLDFHYDRIGRSHTPEANIPLFRNLYEGISELPVYRPPGSGSVEKRPPVRNRWWVGALIRRAGQRFVLRRGSAQSIPQLFISLWHEFHKPPYGGGNQFMLALNSALTRLGAKVYRNRVGDEIDVHICNATWFDVEKFKRASRRGNFRMIHRIDGPVSLYRGSDRGIDERVFELNAQFATATALQSAWCYRQLRQMGFDPVKPVIIKNAVDGGIFHGKGRVTFDHRRKIRLISTAWSDNPGKGGDIYKWLEGHLDWDRFEYTFAGRSQQSFERIRHVPPVTSEKLAALLREHDIYITASQKDPCSNALLEAQACGLPALYLDDGGHPELTGFGGLPFRERDEIPAQLDRIGEKYEFYQSLIVVPNIEDIARIYLGVIHAIS